ncbi:hypothetical protein MIR68_007270 [Amoeboaphelidium protococcarum]|nr:hypothetical protein MIR68_007270 [Amoeboaphelidium protococcarum]
MKVQFLIVCVYTLVLFCHLLNAGSFTNGINDVTQQIANGDPIEQDLAESKPGALLNDDAASESNLQALECPICMEIYGQDQTRAMECCRQQVCADCVDQFKRDQMETCAFCRHPLFDNSEQSVVINGLQLISFNLKWVENVLKQSPAIKSIDMTWLRLYRQSYEFLKESALQIDKMAMSQIVNLPRHNFGEEFKDLPFESSQSGIELKGALKKFHIAVLNIEGSLHRNMGPRILLDQLIDRVAGTNDYQGQRRLIRNSGAKVQLINQSLISLYYDVVQLRKKFEKVLWDRKAVRNDPLLHSHRIDYSRFEPLFDPADYWPHSKLALRHSVTTGENTEQEVKP